MMKARKVYSLKHGSLSLCAVFVLSFAAPAAARGQNVLLSSLPEDGNLVIWGCAARQSTRAREVEAALSDAAWKAALFCGLRAARSVTTKEQSVFPEFSSSEKIKIEPGRGGEFSAYKAALRYNADELRVIGSSVFLRCVYPANLAVVFQETGNGKKPAWIKTLPQTGGGYTFARGFAKRRRYPGGTVAAAYEDAVIALAARQNAEHETRTAGHSAGAYTTESLETSAAAIASFFALEIFIDGKTGDVWILSAASVGAETK